MGLRFRLGLWLGLWLHNQFATSFAAVAAHGVVLGRGRCGRDVEKRIAGALDRGRLEGQLIPLRSVPGSRLNILTRGGFERVILDDLGLYDLAFRTFGHGELDGRMRRIREVAKQRRSCGRLDLRRALNLRMLWPGTLRGDRRTRR